MIAGGAGGSLMRCAPSFRATWDVNSAGARLLLCPGHPATSGVHGPGHRAVLHMVRGKSQNHAYHFSVAVVDINHSWTKTKPPSDQRHLRTASQDPSG